MSINKRAASFGPTPLFEFNGLGTMFEISAVPFADSGKESPCNFGNLLVRLACFSKTYGLMAKLLLNLCTQLECVNFSHTWYYITLLIDFDVFYCQFNSTK